MDHLAILLEQIDFLNCRDVGDSELLEGATQLLVVRSGGLVYCLLLSADRPFTTSADLVLQSYHNGFYLKSTVDSHFRTLPADVHGQRQFRQP